VSQYLVVGPARIKEFERTSTVAANAYVKPLVATYLRETRPRAFEKVAAPPVAVMVFQRRISPRSEAGLNRRSCFLGGNPIPPPA